MKMIRECVNCKKSRGGGSDIWCSEGHPYESYMRETECPYFEPCHDDYEIIIFFLIIFMYLNLYCP